MPSPITQTVIPKTKTTYMAVHLKLKHITVILIRSASARPAFTLCMIYMMAKLQQKFCVYDHELCNSSNDRLLMSDFDIWNMNTQWQEPVSLLKKRSFEFTRSVDIETESTCGNRYKVSTFQKHFYGLGQVYIQNYRYATHHFVSGSCTTN